MHGRSGEHGTRETRSARSSWASSPTCRGAGNPESDTSLLQHVSFVVKDGVIHARP